jgi:hypothetical protein
MRARSSVSTRKPAATAAVVRVAAAKSTGPIAKSRRIFLLSPANMSGQRAQMVVSEHAEFPLAVRLRQADAPLGEIFAFISGLYFRGKLAYARAFADVAAGTPGAFVITACGGLIPPETPVTTSELRRICAADIHPSDLRYREPLERDARLLGEMVGGECEIVLLGSVATPKYVEPLLGIFGERLLFPAEFAGRGDMSRGGLMLRCARSGAELAYVSVATGERHGPRPAKLPKLPRG